MAGHKSTDHPGKDYLSPFKQYRTNISSNDSDPNNVDEVIDLSNSPTAQGNSIVVIPKVLVGSGGFKLTIYWQMPEHQNNDPSVDTDWMITYQDTAFQDPGKPYTFSSVLAGKYKLLIELESSATYHLSVADSVN